MIINFKKEDIHEYKYHFPEDECIVNISVKKTESWEKSLSAVSNFLKTNVGLFEKGGNVFLWVKTENYTCPSQLKRKKNIWNDSRLWWLAKEQCILFSHTNEEAEMYSAIAKIDANQLDYCLNYIRISNSAFLFATSRKDVNWNDIDFFLSSFYFDFEKVINFFYNQNFLFIRAFGNFDDQNLSVDFFGKEEIISTLFPTSEDDLAVEM